MRLSVCGLGGYVAGRLKWRWSNYWVDGGLGASAVVWPQRIFRIWYQRKRGDDDLPSFGQEGMKKAEDKPKGNERALLKNEESGPGAEYESQPDQTRSHRQHIAKAFFVRECRSSSPPSPLDLLDPPFSICIPSTARYCLPSDRSGLPLPVAVPFPLVVGNGDGSGLLLLFEPEVAFWRVESGRPSAPVPECGADA